MKVVLHSVVIWMRRCLSTLLFAAAAWYIVDLLHGQSNDLRAAFAVLTPFRIWAGLFLAILTLACPALYHALEIERLSPIRGAQFATTTAYALSQVARYVPGKIVGIVFEVNFLRGRVDANILILANTLQMVHQYAVTAVVGVPTLLVAFSGAEIFWALLPAAALALFAAIRWGWCEKMLLWATQRIPKLANNVTAIATPTHAATPIFLTLALEWVFFIGMWLVLDVKSVGFSSCVVLAVCYAVSAMLAMFAILMPSGLVVREGLFVWAGTHCGYEPITLLAFATIMRAWLTAADVLLALIAASINVNRSKAHA